jgi:hypothetical protein
VNTSLLTTLPGGSVTPGTGGDGVSVAQNTSAAFRPTLTNGKPTYIGLPPRGDICWELGTAGDKTVLKGPGGSLYEVPAGKVMGGREAIRSWAVDEYRASHLNDHYGSAAGIHGALSIPVRKLAQERFSVLGSYGVNLDDGSTRRIWAGTIVRPGMPPADVGTAAIRVGPALWDRQTRTVPLPPGVRADERDQVVNFARTLHGTGKVDLTLSPVVAGKHRGFELTQWQNAVQGRAPDGTEGRVNLFYQHRDGEIFSWYVAGADDRMRALGDFKYGSEAEVQARRLISAGQIKSLLPPIRGALPPPLKGPAEVQQLEKLVAELRSGQSSVPDASAKQKAISEQLDKAYDRQLEGWDRSAVRRMHDLFGEISRAIETKQRDGTHRVDELKEAVIGSNSYLPRQRLNDVLAATKTAYKQAHEGKDWKPETREEYVRWTDSAQQRLWPGQKQAEGTVTVPHPQFTDGNGRPYDPTVLTSDGRRWLSTENLSHWLRNKGFPSTSGQLLFDNQRKAHVVGGTRMFEVGATVNIRHAKSADLADRVGVTPPTEIKVSAGSGTLVVGGTTQFVKGSGIVFGAFALIPPSDPENTKLYLAGGPVITGATGIISKIAGHRPELAQAMLQAQTAGAAAAKAKLPIGATAAYPVAVIHLKPFAEAINRGDTKAALAACEFGLGGSTVVDIPDKGGSVLFYNARQNPITHKLSVHAGFYENVGGWATSGLNTAATAIATKGPRLVGAGAAVVKSLLETVGRFGEETGTKVQVGWGFRGELTEIRSLNRFDIRTDGGKPWKLDLGKAQNWFDTNMRR